MTRKRPDQFTENHLQQKEKTVCGENQEKCSHTILPHAVSHLVSIYVDTRVLVALHNNLSGLGLDRQCKPEEDAT